MTSGTNADLQADKERLGDILSRREFEAYHDEEFGGRNLVYRWLADLWRKIRSLFPDFEPLPGLTTNTMSYAVIGLGLLLLVWLIYRLSRQLVLHRQLNRKVELTTRELRLTSGFYLEEAAKAAEIRDYREALRGLFLALLFAGKERGWLRIEAWKTNGEYYSEWRRSEPTAASLFAEAALQFERIWYGHGSADASLYEELRSRIEHTLQRADSVSGDALPAQGGGSR